MSKRVLSLNDLVNHDDTEHLKVQKTSSDRPADEHLGEVDLNSADTSISIADLNGDDDTSEITPSSAANEIPGNTKQTVIDGGADTPDVNKRQDAKLSNLLINTKTDGSNSDEEAASNAEISFGSDMTFDYDKQSSESPQQNEPNDDTPTANKPQEAAVLKQEGETVDVLHAQTGEAIVGVSKPKQQAEEVHDGRADEMQEPEAVGGMFEEKASTESKRNSIRKELEILNKISSSSKPNKYKVVPIWARKWRPTINALQNIDTKDFKIDPSFLNIIPDDDLTKSVQDWVYATIHSISPELRNFIELEMKFGFIKNSRNPDRISPPISSQAVYTEIDAHLTPCIEGVLFEELKKYIRSVSEVSENSGKFSIIESKTKDTVYRVGLATQRPRFLRMSTDMATGRVGQFIEKRHVAQLLIYSPKDSYDVKISLNLELPVPDNDPPEKYQSHTPVSERTKDRISYIHNDSCTRFDITKVINHHQGTKGRDSEITHEVELEINTPALLMAFDNITTDSTEYASIIRTFLNNGTIIRRKLTSLSNEIFEGKKK